MVWVGQMSPCLGPTTLTEIQIKYHQISLAGKRFIIGGFLGLILLPIAVGLAVGSIFFLLVLTLAGGLLIPLLAGLIGFIIGALLPNPILSLTSLAIASLRGYLVYRS